MIVFLLPLRQGRFELYSEAPEETAPVLEPHAGRFRRWAHGAHLKWQALVDAARLRQADLSLHDGSQTRLAAWRDSLVCGLADSIAEQRTLSSLRRESAATMRFPSSIDAGQARTALDRLLTRARRHHGRWLSIDLLLFIISGILFFVPGPNLVAYYLAFRVVGHLNSWRGARRGGRQFAWTLEPDANLSELGSLVDLPCETRAPLVAAIAARLNLPRLGAFFERAAA